MKRGTHKKQEVWREPPEEDGKRKKLGLYIHIPFCIRKCDYCDFLSAPASARTRREYVEALLVEIESYRGRTSNYRVPTLFVGGGTPSCIEGEEIKRIMNKVRQVFCLDPDHMEATIEVNPGTVTREKLLCYREAGLSRISFGLQSADNRELENLGRIHSFEEFLENYHLARSLGFHNINADLMSALPGQTSEAWERTLRRVAELEPEHISAYSLIIEEGTKFYERYGLGAQQKPGKGQELPDEDTDRQMYYRTKQVLEEYGYHRYEISNYAKEGYECRHNNSYWERTQYLGLGLGAASLVNNERFTNRKNLTEYLSLCKKFGMCKPEAEASGSTLQQGEALSRDLIGIREESTTLTRKEQMEEFLFLGLRKCDGIRISEFERCFGTEIFQVYGDVLKQLEEKHLIEIREDRLRLTDLGIDLSNSVLSEFLFDEEGE
jgi:oxygen-independent coproporphyrinogen-3 oxidase